LVEPPHYILGKTYSLGILFYAVDWLYTGYGQFLHRSPAALARLDALPGRRIGGKGAPGLRTGVPGRRARRRFSRGRSAGAWGAWDSGLDRYVG
jgi:hypothetical protein